MGNKALKKKEDSEFYTFTKNFSNSSNYICEKPEKISESQIKIPINHNGIVIELTLKNYEYGIIQLLFDYPDKKIRYKPKTDIPTSLKEKPFKKITITEEKIELETEITEFPNSNIKNTLKIDLPNFLITYNLNDNEIFSFNKNKNLQCFNIEKEDNKKLKSNSFDFTYENIPYIIGLSERNSNLFLKDDSYRLFNFDNSEQIIGSNEPIYGSIPLIHGISKNNIISILNDNTSDQWVEIKTNNNSKEVYWITEGGIINLFLFSDNNYYNQLIKLSKLTGNSPLAPLYVFGYHQCKWGYKDLNDVDNVTKKFNEFNIPYDVIWFDIDHTNEKKYFTWDEKNFKNPQNLLDRIKNENRNFVTIIDPHIKKCEGYEILDILKENDCFVKIKNKEGNIEDFIGYCWPTFSYYIDVLNYDKLQKVYNDFFKREDYFLNYDNLGTWVDMNEPSTFTKENENTIPKDSLHFDGENYIEHREVHNLYGFLYQKIAYNSLKNRFNNLKRPFILTRSFYTGSQKYGFIWTGDNKANKDFLNKSIETNIINGFCGISSCGSDVGGFFDNPTEELLCDWYNLGNIYVFFRGHSAINTKRREPWLFSENTLNNITKYIIQRYNILLYIYGKFRKYTLDGISILKPAWMVFRNFFDDLVKVKDMSSIFVFGDEILVVNYLTLCDEGIKFLNNLKIPLYDLYDNCNKVSEFNKEIKQEKFKKFVIGGNIIPWTEEVKNCSYYVCRAPLTLKICCDNEMKSKGNYYLDDGISIDIENNYIDMEFRFEESNLKVVNLNKNFNSNENIIKDIIPIYDNIEIYGLNKQCSKIKINNEKEINNVISDEKCIKINLKDLQMKIYELNDLTLE